jgi:hypothetical protein
MSVNRVSVNRGGPLKCVLNVRNITEYCKNKYGVDGLFWICNHCQKEYYMNYNKPIKCECGRFVYEKYLQKHLKSNIHKNI